MLRWFMKKGCKATGSFVATSCALLVICFSGCAKSDGEGKSKEPNDSSSTQVTSPQDQVAAVNPELLKGVWFGQASLDRNKLQQKMEALSPEQQQIVVAKANSFLSTVMAMDFRSDGTVENEVEIVSIDGQTLRDGSNGQWKVVDSNEKGLMVETREELSDGSFITEKMFYHFFDNGNQLVISTPVSDDLQGCDAMIVFERRTLPDTNVASSPSETMTK